MRAETVKTLPRKQAGHVTSLSIATPILSPRLSGKNCVLFTTLSKKLETHYRGASIEVLFNSASNSHTLFN